MVFVFINRKNDTDTSPDISPVPTVILEPSPTPTPKITVESTPELIFEELPNYYTLAVSLDKENRYFAIDADCMSINPSNVVYKNNTQIMLDNAASDKARVLKIGGREYSLDAHAWILATLSSTELPIRLPIFCGSMELGQIELQ